MHNAHQVSKNVKTIYWNLFFFKFDSQVFDKHVYFYLLLFGNGISHLFFLIWTEIYESFQNYLSVALIVLSFILAGITYHINHPNHLVVKYLSKSKYLQNVHQSISSLLLNYLNGTNEIIHFRFEQFYSNLHYLGLQLFYLLLQGVSYLSRVGLLHVWPRVDQLKIQNCP